jgi:hypothetical protein
MISILRLGGALGKTFFLGVSACNYFIFGLRSFMSMFFLDSSFTLPLPSWQLWRSLALRHAREYVCAMKAIAPLALAFVSLEIISTL